MKTESFKTLGVPVALSVPSTVEEFDQLAKRAGACLDEAVSNVVYRGTFNELRELIVSGRDAEPAKDGQPAISEFKGLEELTGKPRTTKKVKRGDKEVEIYDESPQEYVTRVFGPVDSWNGNAPDVLAKTVAAAGLAVAFDPSAREKQPAGPKKLAEKYKTTATNFLLGKTNPVTKKPYDLKKLQAAFAKDLGGKQFVPVVATPVDDPKNVEALGWVCKEWEAAQDQFKQM